MTKDKADRLAISEAEIDLRVAAEADNDDAWEAPIKVKRKQENMISLPADLASRAAFLAKLHKEEDATAWLKRIIVERIELEEFTFLDFKKTLVSQRRA